MTHPLQFSRRFERMIDTVVRLPYRVKFRWRNRDRLDSWTGAVAAVRKAHASATKLGLANVARVHNISLFVLLIDQDLHWLTYDIMHAVDEEHRVFVARQMAVLLYETVEDLPQLLGKKYRESLCVLGMDVQFAPTLNAITKQLEAFKKEHAQYLKNIRLISGAHRDHDAIKQLELSDGLNPMRIMGLAAELSVPFRALVDDLTRLTLQSANWESMLRDLATKAERQASPSGPGGQA